MQKRIWFRFWVYVFYSQKCVGVFNQQKRHVVWIISVVSYSWSAPLLSIKGNKWASVYHATPPSFCPICLSLLAELHLMAAALLAEWGRNSLAISTITFHYCQWSLVCTPRNILLRYAATRNKKLSCSRLL